MEKKTTISVITVVYNARTLLEGTIKSVIGQTYPWVEYILVDGGSTDGTVELIRQYENQIARWVSEPDKGLYDAMNKGLQMATGDFVWFINAGDHILEPSTIEQALQHCTPETDVLYGEVMYVDADRKQLGTRSELTVQKLPTDLHWKSLRRGMVVSHQGFIARRSMAPPYPEGNLTADIDWVIRVLQAARKVTPTGLVVAEFLEGGISTQRHRAFMRDRYFTLQRHFGVLPNFLAHCSILLRALRHRLK